MQNEFMSKDELDAALKELGVSLGSFLTLLYYETGVVIKSKHLEHSFKRQGSVSKNTTAALRMTIKHIKQGRSHAA